MAEGDAAGVMPGQEVEDAGRYDLDADRLARYLAAQGFGFQRLEAVRKFATGQSNPTFRLDAQPQRYVMRCKPRGKLVPSAHMIEREYAVFRALAQSPVPVPRVLHYCTDTSVVGSEFFVMEFILGRVFAEPALSDAPPSDRRPMYEDALRVLAAIHSVDPAAVPFRRAGAKQQAGQGFYQRQIKRVRWGSEPRAVVGILERSLSRSARAVRQSVLAAGGGRWASAAVQRGPLPMGGSEAA